VLASSFDVEKDVCEKPVGHLFEPDVRDVIPRVLQSEKFLVDVILEPELIGA